MEEATVSLKFSKIIEFVPSEQLDLTDCPKGTQFIMITSHNKYQIGKVEIDRYTNRKYVSNNYGVKFYGRLY